MPNRIIGVCFEDIRGRLWASTLELGTDESSRAACEVKASKIHTPGRIVPVELRKVDQGSRTVTPSAQA